MRFLLARDGLIRENWKFFRKEFRLGDIDDTVVNDRAVDLHGLTHCKSDGLLCIRPLYSDVISEPGGGSPLSRT